MNNISINLSAEDLFEHYENFCFEHGIENQPNPFLKTVVFSIEDFALKFINEFSFHKFFTYSKERKYTDISNNFIFTCFNTSYSKDGFTLVTKNENNIQKNTKYLQKLQIGDCIIVSNDKGISEIYQKTSNTTFQIKYCYSYPQFLNNLFMDSNLPWYAEYLIKNILKFETQLNEDDVTFIKKQLVNYFEYFNFKPYCNTEYYMANHREIFNEKLKDYFIKLNYGV